MTEAKSARPQLPPRPTPIGYEQEKRCCTVCDAKKRCSICNDATLYACSDCRIDLATTVYVCSKSSCRDLHELKCPHRLKAENESLKAELTAMTEDRNLWQQAHDEDCPNRAMIETLESERDRALEVVREYRKRRGRYDHGRDCLGPAECGVVDDDRCPTCINADALLARETKET